MPSKLRIAFLTHEPFYPPSGGGSAEAVYLVQEMVRRGHEVHVFGPMIPEAEAVAKKFGIVLHQFQKWEMGRYAKLRNFKYVLYPFFLERMVLATAQGTKFDLVFSQHAISAVAAGKLKKKLGVPVVMNFPDLLTGFMETWPSYVAPKPLVQALMRYEISLPVRYGVDGECAISDEFTDRLAARGYPRWAKFARSITATMRRRFRCDSNCRRQVRRRWWSCMGRLMRIIWGRSRMTR